MILPCKHEDRVVGQVQPTVDLLTNLDVLHPRVLRRHAIQPADYKKGLVFRSAIESIRGTFIASSSTGRESLVRDVLDNLRNHALIADYRQSGSRARYDFEIAVTQAPDYYVALEVKGGEGNSINISERPIWAKEFGVWCHLDGAIVNQPAHGAHAIINRLANDMVRRQKAVDMLLFKDVLCGTPTRPCPKYPGRESSVGLGTAPDLFLFPQHIPTPDSPQPPVHTLKSLRLASLILELFGVPATAYARHVWEVRVQITAMSAGRFRWAVQIWHDGKEVDRSVSRPWQP